MSLEKGMLKWENFKPLSEYNSIFTQKIKDMRGSHSGVNYVKNWNFESGVLEDIWQSSLGRSALKIKNNKLIFTNTGGANRARIHLNLNIPVGEYMLRFKVKNNNGISIKEPIGIEHEEFIGNKGSYVVEVPFKTVQEDTRIRIFSSEKEDSVKGDYIEIDWVQVTPIDSQHIVVEKTPLGNGLTRVQTWGGMGLNKLTSGNSVTIETGKTYTTRALIHNLGDFPIQYKVPVGGAHQTEMPIIRPGEKRLVNITAEGVYTSAWPTIALAEGEYPVTSPIDFIISEIQITESHNANPIFVKGETIELWGGRGAKAYYEDIEPHHLVRKASFDVDLKQGSFKVWGGDSINGSSSEIVAPYKGKVEFLIDDSIENLYLEQLSEEGVVMEVKDIEMEPIRPLAEPKFSFETPSEDKVVERGWEDFTHYEGPHNLIKNGWDDLEAYGGESFFEDSDIQSPEGQAKISFKMSVKEDTTLFFYRKIRFLEGAPVENPLIVLSFEDGSKKYLGSDASVYVESESSTTSVYVYKSYIDKPLTIVDFYKDTSWGDSQNVSAIFEKIKVGTIVLEKSPLGNGLTRIQTWGGSSGLKLLYNYGLITTPNTFSFYIKNIGKNTVRVRHNQPWLWENVLHQTDTFINISSNGHDARAVLLSVLSVDENDTLDFIASDPIIYEVEQEKEAPKELENLVRTGWREVGFLRGGMNILYNGDFGRGDFRWDTERNAKLEIVEENGDQMALLKMENSTGGISTSYISGFAGDVVVRARLKNVGKVPINLKVVLGTEEEVIARLPVGSPWTVAEKRIEMKSSPFKLMSLENSMGEVLIDWITISDANRQHQSVQKEALDNDYLRIKTWGGDQEARVIWSGRDFKKGEEFTVVQHIKNYLNQNVIISLGDEHSDSRNKTIIRGGQEETVVLPYKADTDGKLYYTIEDPEVGEAMDIEASPLAVYEGDVTPMFGEGGKKELVNLIKNGWDDFKPFGSGPNHAYNWDFSEGLDGWELTTGARGYVRRGNLFLEYVGGFQSWGGIKQEIKGSTDTSIVRVMIRNLGETPTRLRFRWGIRNWFSEYIPEGGTWTLLEKEISTQSGDFYMETDVDWQGTLEVAWIQVTPEANQHLVVDKQHLGNGLTRIRTWGGNGRVKLVNTTNQEAKTFTSVFVDNIGSETVIFYRNLPTWVEKPVKNSENKVVTFENDYSGDVVLGIISSSKTSNLDFIASDPVIVEGEAAPPKVYKTDLGNGTYRIKSELGNLITQWEMDKDIEIANKEMTFSQYIENERGLPMQVEVNGEVVEVEPGHKGFISARFNSGIKGHLNVKYSANGGSVEFIASEPVIIEGDEPYPFKQEFVNEDKHREVKVVGITPRTKLTYENPNLFIGEEYTMYSKIDNKGVDMEMTNSLDDKKIDLGKGETETELVGRAKSNKFIMRLGARNE